MRKHTEKIHNLLEDRSDNARFFMRLLVIVIAFYVLFGYIFAIGVVDGNSMLTTYEDGEIIIASRFAEAGRSDVVFVESDKLGYIVKRVIAVPGDTIAIQDGTTYLNGEPLSEPYVTYHKDNDELEPMTIPEGYYFVMGDNRPVSIDSRSWISVIPKDEIMGVVLFKFL